MQSMKNMTELQAPKMHSNRLCAIFVIYIYIYNQVLVYVILLICYLINDSLNQYMWNVLK